MIKVGIVGLGKMGISHMAAFRAHPDVDLVAVADTSRYSLDILAKYTGVTTFSSLEDMVGAVELDAVVIATPSQLHAPMVRSALQHGLHVFCEKPFVLDVVEGAALVAAAQEQRLVTQVGYHNRFVAAFVEAKRLLDLGAIGIVGHVVAEAYGPVVLKPSGGTWRSRRSAGGGCLYDYAAHPLDLLTWYFGDATAVSGSVLNRVFSRETDDEVFSTVHFSPSTSAQLSVSWSDESERKMSTSLKLWGSEGHMSIDRQEIKVYLRDTATCPDGYRPGWNVKYTTDLTEPVWYYLRGEEYSAQVDAFVQRILAGETEGRNSFADALRTDKVLAMILADSQKAPATRSDEDLAGSAPEPRGWRTRFRRTRTTSRRR
jgi:scyllo-inositol 2-dehydrogenase (NADP+)